MAGPIKPKNKITLDDDFMVDLPIDNKALSSLKMRSDSAYEKNNETKPFAEPKETINTNNSEDAESIFIKLPTGKEAKSKRVKVDPNETTLFSGNPRINSQEKDEVARLTTLIKDTKGNAVPAWGRQVNGKIEIIAGFRRRAACIQASEMLNVELFDDINEEEAYYLTELENSGRVDPDPVAMCLHYASRLDNANQIKRTMTVEDFARQQGISRQKMQSRISVGRLPKELFNVIGKHTNWDYKNLDILRAEVREAITAELFSKVLIELADLKEPSPSKVLSAIRTVTNKRQRTRNVKHLGSNGRYGSIESSASGALRLKIAKDMPDTIREKVADKIKEIEELFSSLD